ncbi:MAG TPA: hypothetical protein VGL25_17395 [Casimicrobiaceae bacterium]|jgi:hypothetical protein
MSKHPVKAERRAVRSAEREAVEAMPPTMKTFASFRYASAEISVRGGKAHVRARRAQWEDGKFTSEAFEGEVDRTVYERAVLQAQRYFIAQTVSLFQSFAELLPFAGTRPRDRG